tara:strand:- start:357 stop:506 length:150 start_codon:yes stop_codon:yes gene_type:complete
MPGDLMIRVFTKSRGEVATEAQKPAPRKEGDKIHDHPQERIETQMVTRR